MDVKEAVKEAINYVRSVFANETLSNIGLEEITLNEDENCWEVTVGFSRPWDYPRPQPSFFNRLHDFNAIQTQTVQPEREYKVVKIGNNDGEVKSIKIRERAN